MDVVSIAPLLDQLGANLDNLEGVLEPILGQALSETATKLPALDQAKLYVLITYALESMLFSLLRLNGVHATNHPVFRELARVKQYFEKIKVAETGPQKRENLSLDKKAAGRLIKHALAGHNQGRNGDQSKQSSTTLGSVGAKDVMQENEADEEMGDALSESDSDELAAESEPSHEDGESSEQRKRPREHEDQDTPPAQNEEARKKQKTLARRGRPAKGHKPTHTRWPENPH